MWLYGFLAVLQAFTLAAGLAPSRVLAVLLLVVFGGLALYSLALLRRQADQSQ